ncbi:MAG: methyltransferase domain-containing protein [Solirubrobacterales bacterium]
MSDRDEVQAGESWEFDEEVAQVFDDMLSRSIPQYDVMRQAVSDLASRFLIKADPADRNPIVVDLGASRGEALAPLVELFRGAADYHAVEVSAPMLEELRRRFDSSVVDVHDFDLRNGYPDVGIADATLAILTIQFTPIEHRQRIIRDVYKHTRDGGAFLFVEKVLGQSAELDELMKKLYYDLKGKNGYSPEQIERKRLSLEGVLVPVTAKWNEDLLRSAGFSEVDCFWRWQNFAGWLAIK